jgi:DNA repair protein RAD16
MNENHVCSFCKHGGLRHVSVFNQELLNPIQKYGKTLLGAEAFRKLRLLTSKIMLRRQKQDHMDAMELPIKETIVDRQFFGEVEKDFADSIMNNNQRRFDTYVSQGVLLNNYANIFGLLSQMRQVADHPDLILRKENAEGRNIMVCCICDDAAEDAIRSQCRHDFCRACVSSYINSTEEPTCPRCHIKMTIDLEQPEIEQDQEMVKKNSIINRIKMENWTSSTKMEMLVHSLQKLRSDNSSHKSIVFSQFTGMLQLIEWRLRRAGITTVMLDGSMTPAQRAASINHFMTNVDVECFLVSLKAGGVALNLTEASRVFIVDPSVTPCTPLLAQRCLGVNKADFRTSI